jgi:DUF1365 family protein
MFLLYLDLGELSEVFRGRWLWSSEKTALARFRRRDHLGASDEPLDASVRALVRGRLGMDPRGPIRILTHLAYFGYRFNPVSFYYLFEEDGRTLSAIVAEINNTPWGEQHCYVLDGRKAASFQSVREFRLEKEFHISPFLPMDMEYRWRFSVPGKTLAVHMESLTAERKLFDATLLMERHRLTTLSLNRRLVTFPFMTLQVISRIYWQAFRLWWKRTPYHPRPERRLPKEEVDFAR